MLLLFAVVVAAVYGTFASAFIENFIHRRFLFEFLFCIFFALFLFFFWLFSEATGITGYFSNTLFVFRVIADVFEFAIGSLQLLSGYNISTVGLSFVL